MLTPTPILCDLNHSSDPSVIPIVLVNSGVPCSKQTGEKLGERTLGEEHKVAVGLTIVLSKGRRRELKADSVLGNWNNYKLSDYSF